MSEMYFLFSADECLGIYDDLPIAIEAAKVEAGQDWCDVAIWAHRELRAVVLVDGTVTLLTPESFAVTPVAGLDLDALGEVNWPWMY